MNIQEKAIRINEFFAAKTSLANNLTQINTTINSSMEHMKSNWAALQTQLDIINATFDDPSQPFTAAEYNALIDQYNDAINMLVTDITNMFGALQITISEELGTFKNYEKR